MLICFPELRRVVHWIPPPHLDRNAPHCGVFVLQTALLYSVREKDAFRLYYLVGDTARVIKTRSMICVPNVMMMVCDAFEELRRAYLVFILQCTR